MAVAGVSGDRRALVARGVSRAAEFMGNISQDSLWCTGVTGGRRKFNSPRTNGRFIHGLILRHFAQPRVYFRLVHRVATYRFFFLEMANLAERDAIRCIIWLPRVRPENTCDAACFDVSAKCRSRVNMSSTYIDDNYVIVRILVNRGSGIAWHLRGKNISCDLARVRREDKVASRIKRDVFLFGICQREMLSVRSCGTVVGDYVGAKCRSSKLHRESGRGRGGDDLGRSWGMHREIISCNDLIWIIVYMFWYFLIYIYMWLFFRIILWIFWNVCQLW